MGFDQSLGEPSGFSLLPSFVPGPAKLCPLDAIRREVYLSWCWAVFLRSCLQTESLLFHSHGILPLTYINRFLLLWLFQRRLFLSYLYTLRNRTTFFYIIQDECDRLTAVACTSRRSTARPRVCGPARAGLQPAPAQAGVARRIG